MDTTGWRFDLLDSEVSLSPPSLHGYAMRGPHFVASEASRLRGLELFAGAARPALFDNSEGYLGGATLPLAGGPKWRARAALLAVAPRSPSAGVGGGGAASCGTWTRASRRIGARASRERRLTPVAPSLGGRADAGRGDFNFYAETLRFDRRSPLAALGAQAGGRRLHALALNWRPQPRLSASFSYSRASANFTSRRLAAALDNSTLFADLNLNFTDRSRLSLRYVVQEIETGAGLASPLRLQTRRLAATHSVRFNRRWSNEFEGAYAASREQAAGSQLERGLNVREELRFSRDNWSATGFVNYQSNTLSLAGLIVRNPHLLPTALRETYESDPARFLAVNRGVLPALLAGVGLPEARNTAVSLRLQAALSRYQLIAESRYSDGEAFAREQRYLATAFSAAARLDAANSIRVSGARAFAFAGAPGHAAFTVSFVHRLGVPGGLEISRLFGLDRRRIEGRVFFDLNSDGRDDPEESGAAGVTVQLDGTRSATTDGSGRFRFSSLPPGEYAVAILSDKLGVSGVRVLLRGTGMISRTTDASGLYEFRNLPPGNYTLEIDPLSPPADFRLPARLSWPVTLSSQESLFVDIPLAARRAVSGVISLDRDGDGRFDPARDTPLAGARVTAGPVAAITDGSGSYLLRGLPASPVAIRVIRRDGKGGREIILNLSAEPVFKQGHDIGFAH